MRPSLLSIALAASLASAAVIERGTKQEDLVTCVAKVFGDSAKARMVQPSDETYTDARIGETIQFEQFPQLIAYADDAAQVPQLLACAKRIGVPPVPRSGGHHFMAYSALNGSLVIDITHIDYVSVSADKSTATVGAGIRLGPLYTALAAQGRDWPGGICPTVGLSGFLGAGGFNMQMRQLGLGVDHVLSAKVVLSTGELVVASPSQNADLFFAIRGGGGGTYGIVVEWTLALMQFPRSAMVLVNWNEINTSAQVANAFLDWAPNADSSFMSQVNVHKNFTQVVGWCYGCSLQKAQALMNQSGLLKIGKPEVHISGNCSSENARMISYVLDECVPDATVAQYAPLALNYPQQPFTNMTGHTPFAWNETRQQPAAPAAEPWARFLRISKSFFLQKSRKLDHATVASLVDRIHSLPTAAAAWGEWHAWNIAGPDNQAAFAWRDQAYAHLEFIITGSDDVQIEQGDHDFMSNLEKYLRPVAGPASYPGYMDDTISTPPLTSYYGANVNKLSQIKRKYDPFDFFSNPLSITPAAS